MQAQLAETENQISFARQYYNDAVATLNKLAQTIPWMLFTGVTDVHKRDFYHAPEGQETAPQVSS
jgi:LemA protein